MFSDDSKQYEVKDHLGDDLYTSHMSYTSEGLSFDFIMFNGNDLKRLDGKSNCSTTNTDTESITPISTNSNKAIQNIEAEERGQ
jgi:hypothetical protein